MDINSDNKENRGIEVREYSAERCFDMKAQRYSNAIFSAEVEDFVREVVEAVAYIVDHQNACRRREHTVEEVFEISDTDSSKNEIHAPVRRYRKVTVKQLADQEKRIRRRRIAAEKMKNREPAVEEKRRKKEEAHKKREKLKREQEEAREKKRREDQQRKKKEEEKRERRKVEEEIRKQKREKEEEERKRKRKEDEEKREKRRREEEEVQIKKKRESDRFLSFFDKKRKTEKDSDVVQASSVLNILPFFCKQGVSLAPMFRREPLSKEVHESLLLGEQKLNRSKLFQFHDNWRPPYYGTWRKRSTIITGRKPFAKDTKVLDYEVDSDEEWEIPEGDDCDESTMSEDEDSDHSSDVDGFIVQHGYLSEGEGEDEQDRLEHREDSNKRAERLQAVANEWKHNLEQKSKRFNKPLIPLLWGPHFELTAKGVPKDVEQAVFFKYSDGDDNVEDDYDGDGSSNSYHDDVCIED